MKFLQCLLLSSLLISGCSKKMEEKIVLGSISATNYKWAIVEKEVLEEVDDSMGRVVIDNLLDEPFYQASNNKRYVYHDIEGNPTTAGPVFLDSNSKLSSSNLILYGHSSTKRDTYFTKLQTYLNDESVKNYPIIKLVIDDVCTDYKIFSVYLVNTNDQEHPWLQTDFVKGYLYDVFIDTISNSSIYSINFKKTNQIVTLVTCYTKDTNYRLIIHGMKTV